MYRIKYISGTYMQSTLITVKTHLVVGTYIGIVCMTVPT